jgi:transglutaminase-like putative cysteine protease
VDAFLRPTPLLDADHPAIRALAEDAAGDATTPRERAVRVYYAVRDGLRYDPYDVVLTPESMRASAVLAAGRGYCVAKAGVLAAAARALGIPARLGFADVRNHLATERLRQMMQTDVFYWHGYTELLLDGRWLKATPAFNRELCDKFGVLALEFDGTGDSVFHPFDRAGRRHMEYVNDHGWRDDLPLDELLAAMHRHYPGMAVDGPPPGGDFHAEAERERR